MHRGRRRGDVRAGRHAQRRCRDRLDHHEDAAGGRRHDDPRRLHGDDGRRRHPRQRHARRGDRGPCAPRRLRGRLRPAVELDHMAERRHAVEPRQPGRDRRRSDGGARRHPRRRPRWPGRGHRACVRRPVRVHDAPPDVRKVLPRAGDVREPGPRERPERLRSVEPDHGGLPRQLVGARIRLGPVRHDVPGRLERYGEDAPVVRWLEAHGPAMRRIPGAVVRLVERVLVRRPPHRRCGSRAAERSGAAGRPRPTRRHALQTGSLTAPGRIRRDADGARPMLPGRPCLATRAARPPDRHRRGTQPEDRRRRRRPRRSRTG